jgi:hypothetical protein
MIVSAQLGVRIEVPRKDRKAHKDKRLRFEYTAVAVEAAAAGPCMRCMHIGAAAEVAARMASAQHDMHMADFSG